MNTQRLEKQLRTSLAAESLGYLDESLAANRDMNTLLSRLAQYAVAGSEVKEKQSGDLGLLFDSALRRLANQNANAEFSAEPVGGRSIQAPYSAETVLRELLDNALKFRQGPVKITLLVQQLPENNVVGLRDTGIGFETEFFEKIMRPLERLHPASTYPGFGLGLSICQRTVEAWGGTLWADSALSRGSTFWFSLPT